MSQVQVRQCLRKEVSGRRVAGAIRNLVNAKDLQLECDKVLHESLFMTIFM